MKQCHHLNRQAKRLLIESAIVLFAIIPLAGFAEVGPADSPLPRILRDWAKRRQDVGLVTYRFSGTRTWPQGAFTEEALPPALKPGYVQEAPPFSKPSAEDYLPVTNAPPEENPLQDVSGAIKSTVTLDFKNNRCRLEWDGCDYNNVSKQVTRYRTVEVGSEGIRRVNILESDNPNSSSTTSRVDFTVATGERKLIPRSGCFEEFLPICFASGIVPVGIQYVKSVDVSPAIDTAAFRFEGYAMEAGRRIAHLSVDRSTYYFDIRNDFWVDTGLSRADLIARGVTAGTRVVWSADTVRMGEHITGKALDDRVSLAVMTELVRRVKRKELRWDLTLACTVQEEIGMIGAAALAARERFDAAIIVEIGLAGDIPGVRDDALPIRLGGGPALVHKDSGVHYDHALTESLERCASDARVPIQHGVLTSFASDGTAFMKADIPTAMMVFPARYTHTPFETAHLGDIERMVDWLVAFVTSK